MSAAPWSPVTSRLEAGHEQQSDNLDGIIGAGDRDGPPTLGLGQHFGVIDGNSAAVSQVNDERLKRSGGMQCTQLFNRHGDILAGQSQAINWVHTRICGRRFFLARRASKGAARSLACASG